VRLIGRTHKDGGIIAWHRCIGTSNWIGLLFSALNEITSSSCHSLSRIPLDTTVLSTHPSFPRSRDFSFCIIDCTFLFLSQGRLIGVIVRLYLKSGLLAYILVKQLITMEIIFSFMCCSITLFREIFPCASGDSCGFGGITFVSATVNLPHVSAQFHTNPRVLNTTRPKRITVAILTTCQ